MTKRIALSTPAHTHTHEIHFLCGAFHFFNKFFLFLDVKLQEPFALSSGRSEIYFAYLYLDTHAHMHTRKRLPTRWC